MMEVYKMFAFITYILCCHGYGWIPLLDLKTYNTKSPSQIQVLDKEVVVWEKNGKVVVQDNACLHRKAPLSEGYIDKNTGNLRCSYHGWEYSTNGSIVHIPQKTCIGCQYIHNTYLTKIHNDILWMKTETTDQNDDLPQHITNVTDVGNDTVVVELPYSMNILLENFFDPAHIPFAHHELQSHRDLASSVNSSLIKMDENGICFYFEDATLPNGQFRNGTMTFYNPNHYELRSIYPENVFFDGLHIYCVPLRGYKTRIFMQQKYKKRYQKFIFNQIPSFIKHSLTMTFLDSDTMLLYKQQRHLLRDTNNINDSVKSYLTPTSSDYSVLMFHKWLKKYNPHWLQYLGDDSQYNDRDDLDRTEVFNRYAAHTKSCRHCSDALTNLRKIQIGIPICILLVNLYDVEITSLTFAFVLYMALDEISTYFTFRDYIHNEK